LPSLSRTSIADEMREEHRRRVRSDATTKRWAAQTFWVYGTLQTARTFGDGDSIVFDHGALVVVLS